MATRQNRQAAARLAALAEVLEGPVTLEIGGVDLELPRSREILVRVEAACGAAAPLAALIEVGHAPQSTVVRAYAAILKGVPNAPPLRAIEHAVFEKGSRHVKFALYLYSLALGVEEIETLRAQLRRSVAMDGGESGGGENGRQWPQWGLQ